MYTKTENERQQVFKHLHEMKQLCKEKWAKIISQQSCTFAQFKLVLKDFRSRIIVLIGAGLQLKEGVLSFTRTVWL